MSTGSPSKPRALEERLAINEAIERDLNAATARWFDMPGGRERRHSFWCECTEPECGELLLILKSEWDRVRSNPRRFFVASGPDRVGPLGLGTQVPQKVRYGPESAGAGPA
jgi:hypothetical protein